MARIARVKKHLNHELRRANNPEEARAVVEEVLAELKPKVLSKQKTPGEVIGNKKTITTYEDLCHAFPIATFRPEETIPLTFNGVKVQAYAGIEMHVPLCFKSIYENHREALRNSGKLSDSSGYINTIELGAGALPPE